MSKKKNEIKELSEILSTALAGRPDLNKRLSSMLATRHAAGMPGTEEQEPSHKERKAMVRDMFNRDFLRQELKTALG